MDTQNGTMTLEEAKDQYLLNKTAAAEGSYCQQNRQSMYSVLEDTELMELADWTMASLHPELMQKPDMKITEKIYRKVAEELDRRMGILTKENSTQNAEELREKARLLVEADMEEILKAMAPELGL